MFARLRQRDIALLVLGLLVVIALLWYYLLYTPVQNQISQTQNQLAALKAQVLTAEAAERSLPQLRASIAQLKVQEALFLKALPLTVQSGPLVRALHTRINQVGAVLQNISQSVGGTSVARGVEPIGISLSLKGTFQAIYALLHQVQHMQRFAVINSLSLGGSGGKSIGASPLLQVQLSLSAYSFLPKQAGVTLPRLSPSAATSLPTAASASAGGR